MQGLLPGGGEPRGRLGQRQDAAPGPGQPRLAGGARPADDRVGHLLEGRPRDRDRRAGHRGDRHRDLLPARRQPRREGGLLHPDPADAAVARPGGPAARRLPERAGVLRRPRQPDPREARRLHRRDGPPAARPGLGLPGRRARRARRRGGAQGDQRHRPRRGAAVGLHRAEGRRVDVLRLLDLLRRVRRRGQPGAAPQAALGAGPGRLGVGLGVAGQPPHPLQPRLGRARRHPVERAQALRVVGRRAGPLDRLRRARLHRRPGPRPRAREGRQGPRRDRRAGPVRDADRRQGLAVLAGRGGRRPAADALRAARVAAAQPALPAAEQPRRGASSTTPRTRSTPATPRSSPTSSPPTGSPSTTRRAR